MFLFLGFIFLSVFPTYGQNGNPSANADRPVRVEIPAKTTDETYHLIPLGTKGALLYFKSVEVVSDTLTKWYFSFYDSDFHLKWIKNIPVRTGLEIRDYFTEKDTVDFLFLTGEKTKGVSGSEMIVRLDLSSGTFTGNRHTMVDNVIPVKFLVLNGIAFVGYNLKNEPSHIQVINLRSGKITDSPLTTAGTPSNLTGFIADTLSSAIFATIRKAESKNHVVSDLLKINFSGTLLSETELSTISPLWELGSPQLIMMNTDDILVISTYSATGHSGKSSALTSSSGFYTCRVKNGVQTDIRFKNFLELKNFKNVIQEKELMAIKKKANKKNKPVDNYTTEVNLLVHPLIFHNDQIIIVAESYVPEYHSENFTEFDFYGRPYINTYNVFDGYRYTSAMIAGFDRSGNLRWDNSMEIRNLISTELTPKVNVFFSSMDLVVLCYSSEGRIASKIIKENDVVEKLDFSAMDQLNPEDKMLTDSKSFMVPWYGSFFLCYGYQDIKNINSSEDKKRLVFYFTKVKFD